MAVLALLIGAGAGAVSIWLDQRVPAGSQETAAVEPPRLEQISLSGILAAGNVVAIPAPIEGVLEMVMVDVGDEVHENMLLARIQNTALNDELQLMQEDLKDAEGQVNALESQLIAARLEESRARADLARAREAYDEARREADRQRNLYRQGATPRMVYQKAQADLENVRKEYEAVEAAARQAQSRLEAAQIDLDASRRRVEELNRMIEEVAEDLAAADVMSPVSGIVTGMAAGQGEGVHPGMEALFLIAVDLSRMQVILEPSPAEMTFMHPGQSVRVYVAEVPNEAFEGTITEMTVDRTVVEFANPTPRIRPGLSARVVVPVNP